ncbi:MAG: acyl-CoA dehydratase activase [Chitinispirillia bacterium]|jgi:predicted CoA-substrate-specific enzyme activase
MDKQKNIYIGVDIGASHTKVVILDELKQVIGQSIKKSGVNYSDTAEFCLKDALKKYNNEKLKIRKTVATGYGRKNVTFSDDVKTEIACHAKGCYHYFPKKITIIDIGGQDNKIIKLDAMGKRISFKMNRKCAAGTGSFLEEIAMRLDISLNQMNDLAKHSSDMVELGSFCTVFSATEVLHHIGSGKKVEDIVKGLFLSVIKRVLEMDSVSEHVVMTGGVVAYNPYLVKMAGMRMGKKILVPEFPQLTGAFGAALYAMN